MRFMPNNFQDPKRMTPREIYPTIDPLMNPFRSSRQVQIESQKRLMHHLKGWLQTYADSTSGLEMRADTTVELDDGTQTHVGALLRVQENAGGQSRVEGGSVVGSPELIIETFDGVSPGRRHQQQVEYSKKGITESIIVDREDMAPWYCSGNYTLQPSGKYTVSGTTFPGLRLNIEYLYDGDLSAQLLQLRAQLGSGMHRRYEERLEAGG